MTPELVGELWDRKSDLNRKSIYERLLINKQGAILLRSLASVSRVHDLKRIQDLAEVALVAGVFCDNYHKIHRAWPDFADLILEGLTGWIIDPKAHLHKTYGHRLAFESLINEFALTSRLRAAQDGMQSLDASRSVIFANYRQTWWEDPLLYQVLGEQVASSAGLGTAFISDPHMRSILSRDIAETQRALDAGNYKSTMVLAGSVIEAALLAALSQRFPTEATTFHKRTLSYLLEQAEVRGVIDSSSDARQVGDVVREYRNLIHPAKERRGKIEPNQERARISISAMRIVLQELNHHFS